MNFKAWCILISLGALLAGCGGKKEEPKEAAAEKAPEAESHVKHGTNGEVIVTVEAKMQPTIGLQTAPLQPAQLSPELKAYGHVLDPSPLASVVAELVTAEAAAGLASGVDPLEDPGVAEQRLG